MATQIPQSIFPLLLACQNARIGANSATSVLTPFLVKDIGNILTHEPLKVHAIEFQQYRLVQNDYSHGPLEIAVFRHALVYRQDTLSKFSSRMLGFDVGVFAFRFAIEIDVYPKFIWSKFDEIDRSVYNFTSAVAALYACADYLQQYPMRCQGFYLSIKVKLFCSEMRRLSTPSEMVCGPQNGCMCEMPEGRRCWQRGAILFRQLAQKKRKFELPISKHN